MTRKANEDDARQAAFRRIDRQFARMEALMADGCDTLVFGRRTVADAYFTVMTRWKDATPLAAFNARLVADPGVRHALDKEG